MTKIKNRLNRVNPLDLLTNVIFIYAQNFLFSCLPYIRTNSVWSMKLWSYGIHFYLDFSLGVFSRYESIRTSSMEHWRSSNSSIAATNICISAFFKWVFIRGFLWQVIKGFQPILIFIFERFSFKIRDVVIFHFLIVTNEKRPVFNKLK